LKKQRKYLAHCDIQLILSASFLTVRLQINYIYINYMHTNIILVIYVYISVLTKNGFLEKVEYPSSSIIFYL
jgi:hypothetical protein